MRFLRWFPTFLAFPLAGLVTITVVGPLDGPLPAAAGGLLAGAIIGGAQWLALRPLGVSRRWIGRTAVAMAAGAAVSTLLTGAATTAPALMTAGLVTGAAVGIAQAPLLPVGRRGAAAGRAAWVTAVAAGWSLGWLATWATIVDVERGYHVFGSSGALVATGLTWFVLRAVRQVAAAPAPSTRDAAVVA